MSPARVFRNASPDPLDVKAPVSASGSSVRTRTARASSSSACTPGTAVGELLGHEALLDRRAVQEVDAGQDDGRQPQPAQRHRGADACDQDAPRRVANQVVGTAGHQLWLVLLRHRGAPVTPDVHARPDREPQPQGEADGPCGAPRIGVEAVAPKRSQANQEITGQRSPP